jgi:hypothetical protein
MGCRMTPMVVGLGWAIDHVKYGPLEIATLAFIKLET